MKRGTAYRVSRTVSWSVGIVIFIIMVLPLALYIPWVQNKAKDIACRVVREKTGMELQVGQVLIKFPLDISLDDMSLLDEKGDTMVAARNFTASVALRPLLDKKIKIDGAQLIDGKYRLASEDSSMLLEADVHHCKLTGADVDIEGNKVNLASGEVTGGKVLLSLFPYRKVEEPDTAQSKPWLIQAQSLKLNDIDYTMEMLPTIDNLTAHVDRAELKDGIVDTGAHTVDARCLAVDGVDGKYIYPSQQWAKQYDKEHPLPTKPQPLHPDTIPWTVRGDSVSITRGSLTYAQKGATPGKGLDMSHIAVKDLNFGARDLYNRGDIVSIDIKNLSLKERSGLEIKQTSGKAMVNSQDIQLNQFKLKTKGSSIDIDGKADMSLLDNNPSGSVKITTNSSVDLHELGTIAPSLAKATKQIPSQRAIKIKGSVEGNTRNLDIHDALIEIPGHAKASISGNIHNITSPKDLQANVTVDADLKDVRFAKAYLDKDLQKKLDIPPMRVKGSFNGNTHNLNIKNGYLDIPGHIKTNVDGNIANINTPNKLQANVAFDADVNDIDFAKKAFLDKDTQKKFNVLPMKIKGKVNYNPSHVEGDVDMRLKGGGSLAGKGSFAMNSMTYNIDATAKSLPVKKLVPQLDVNNLTAQVKASGHGFDFLSNNTSTNAQVKLGEIDFAGKHYRNIDADVKLNGSHFDARVNTHNHGSLMAKGSFDPKSQKYDIDADAKAFPVNEFFPELKMGKLTAKVKAKGQKFDFLKPGTRIDADVDLGSVEYNHQVYKDLTGKVFLDGNRFDGHINSSNPDCDVYADAVGTINGDHYTIDLNGNVRDLDLKALNILDIPCDGQGNIDLQGDFNIKTKTYNANVKLHDLNWNYNGEKIFSQETDLRLNTTDHSISAYYNEQSTYINFNAPHSIDYFIKCINNCSSIAQKQYKKMDMDVNELCDALPQFDMTVKMGPNGLVQRLLGRWDIDFRDVDLTVSNDTALRAHAYASTLSFGNTAIDTLNVNINQFDKMIGFAGSMANRKGTWDEMAKVNIGGYAIGSQLNLTFKQENIKHETGYSFGFNANLQDSILDFSVISQQPVVAYRQWNINDDNYVRIDLGQKRLEADLMLESDSSLIALRTDPLLDEGKQNILADIKNVRIEEWTNMIPSLTDMSGVVDADLKLSFDGHNVEGNGDVSLSNFTYNGIRQGDMKMATNLTIDPATSSTHINANLDMDGSNVALAFGSINDETTQSPLNLSLNLNRFPLRKVSAFIPGRMIFLTGYANGEMTVSGTTDNPAINGFLVGDSAFVKLPRYGSSLRLSEERINVDNNTITFKNYKIYGLNNKTVDVNGDVDFRAIDNIKMDLTLNGKDIQFFGSEQKPYSEIFGKGYIDINGRLKMHDNNTSINADTKLLAGSDITYVLQDEVTNLANSSANKDMVKFINPNDSAWYNDSIITGGASASALNLLVNVDIEKGAKINAFLQPEGKDRVNIDGQGNLRYSIDFAGKDNLSGSYIINSGIVRYTPPVISQKVFNVVDGSNITWNGDMLNPKLDLEAKHSVRTSVQNSNGSGSRLVDFDITAMLKNTLSNIDLKFDLEAKNDAIVEGDLQTMTENQRSQAAINLLLYNSYSGSNTTGDFSTTGALFSFLQSQINSWAANNLKGVDISFGINQYEGSYENGARTETSYSYRLSKSLFGDRFKIAIGGEYSTEASSEQNFSQNLISDISFEYLLNATGTRYVRLFRHKSIESVLEGEVTVTGVGFVMKHKISSFADLFKWLKKTPKIQLPENINTPIDSNSKTEQVSPE